MKLTKQQARHFLVQHHKLDRKQEATKENILGLFNTMYCIQYDPLNVVGRNPDLVLQARLYNYDTNLLHELLYQDRVLIDAWDKMMAIYKVTDWPYFNRIRHRMGQGTKGTLAYRNSLEAMELCDDILELIKKEGPLQASKLPSDSAGKGRWGHKKLSSAALDYLYAIGDVCVYDKTNTQKIYDLTENIIPEKLLSQADPFGSEDTEDSAFAFSKWYALRRIKTMGILWNKSGGAWLGYYIQKKGERTPIIEALLAENEILPLEIEGIKEPFYTTPEIYEDIKSSLLHTSIEEPDPSTSYLRFLGPLDNFLWDRDMIEAVFDFTYRWEVYTPVKKRQYGYYVLPILYNNELVARIEFDYYRKGKRLKTLKIWYEDGFKPDSDFKHQLKQEKKHFEKYLKASYKNK